jgi:two-component system chemotaxis response regulator CheB
MSDIALELIAKIKAAAQAKGVHVTPLPPALYRRQTAKADPELAAVPTRIVTIGVSTGGPNALQYVLSQLPGDFPGTILVVQHMPDGFTDLFARRLNETCAIQVKEAQSGDLLLPGRALICPGNRHMKVKKLPLGNVAILSDDARVNGHRPSVDVLFRSAADEFGAATVAVIMTGMGDDGAEGLGAVKAAGGMTIAQNEESCVVYGMPKAAVERGYALRIVALEVLASTLQVQCSGDNLNRDKGFGTKSARAGQN